jgi:hypothetical protein
VNGLLISAPSTQKAGPAWSPWHAEDWHPEPLCRNSVLACRLFSLQDAFRDLTIWKMFRNLCLSKEPEPGNSVIEEARNARASDQAAFRFAKTLICPLMDVRKMEGNKF